MPRKPQSDAKRWAKPRSPDTRPSASARGYGPRWRKARESYLKRHPVCVVCQAHGRLTPATVVDHIIPHKGDYQLMWDRTNWQALCESCHNSKTMKESKGIG